MQQRRSRDCYAKRNRQSLETRTPSPASRIRRHRRRAVQSRRCTSAWTATRAPRFPPARSLVHTGRDRRRADRRRRWLARRWQAYDVRAARCGRRAGWLHDHSRLGRTPALLGPGSARQECRIRVAPQLAAAGAGVSEVQSQFTAAAPSAGTTARFVHAMAWQGAAVSSRLCYLHMRPRMPPWPERTQTQSRPWACWKRRSVPSSLRTDQAQSECGNRRPHITSLHTPRLNRKSAFFFSFTSVSKQRPAQCWQVWYGAPELDASKDGELAHDRGGRVLRSPCLL